MLGAALLVSCTSREHSADGILVFDEDVTLVRGPQRDAVQRELSSDGGVYVAILREDDFHAKLRLSHGGTKDAEAASVEVDSAMLGAGIEIAVLDVPRGSRLTFSLDSPQEWNRPGTFRLRVVRYDEEAAMHSSASARIAALRSWAAATGAQLTGDELKMKAFQDLDLALRHLESADGEPSLAAWGRLVRARLGYRQLIDLRRALKDERIAAQGFAALGDRKNTARARFAEAETLAEIATDSSARDPSAAEAAREATRIYTNLIEDPAFGAYERARCMSYLGAHLFNIYQWPQARTRSLAALALYDDMGFRKGRLQVLQNLGTIAIEEGDYALAARYFDRVLPELEGFGSLELMNVVLFNAAGADINLGNIDRAIERLMRARELARQTKLPQQEARVLHGLGRAYWARGDMTQAATLLREALKLRRTIDDGFGVMTSLRANGVLARETGDVATAIEMHREVEARSITADLRQYALLELARDYAAASDLQRAIAVSREALSIRIEKPNIYRRSEVQLTLASALLSQPRRTTEAIDEAAALAQEALAASTRRSDILLELEARRLLAQSLVVRGELGKAREEYERAIALIFRYRSTINNPELQAAALAHERQTFQGYVELLMHDVAHRGPGKLLGASAAEENALRTLEWARGLNFDSAKTSQLDAGTQERVSVLLAQMAGKRVRVAALLDRASEAGRELEILELDIAQLRAEVDRLRAAAARNVSQETASSTVVEPWPALTQGTTQLSYSLDTEHPYLWVRDASGIRSTLLAVRGDAIARDLAALAEATRTRAPERVDELLARLSRAVLPAGTLAENSATLEVVGDGGVAAIPFAALTSPDAGAGRLAERRSVVMITSLFEDRTPSRAAHPRPVRFSAVASDARSKGATPGAQVFSTLHATNAEARSIAAMFRARNPASTIKLMIGAEGDAGNLKRIWQDGVDVIHFATHGLADTRQPLTSLLLLPALDAQGIPTYLTAGQVQEWRGDADLVYLSACDTAVGHGMQDAFLRAGARGVVATLWPVEDVYASQFAADFYRRYTAGMPAAQALSETQRAWMKPAPGIRESEQVYRRMTAWAHSYYAQ